MTRPAARLVSFPEPRDLDDYRAASEEIETALTQLPGFVALYRLGSVRHPGISDLDRIAVVEAGDPVPSIWDGLSPDARYVAMHGPFLVDVGTFRSHRWFTHLKGLELAAGEEPAVGAPSDPARCDLHLAAEGLALLALKLVALTRTGRLKVRSALCEFHAIRISLTLAALDAEAAPAAWGFVDAVADARSGWFERPAHVRPAVMADLLSRARDGVVDALLALERELGDHAPAATAALPLRAPWDAVTLVGCDPQSLPSAYADAATPTAVSRAVGRSRRLGALRWRTASVHVPVPARVLGLLAETRAGASDLHRERRQVIEDYRQFLATRGRGFSHIGLGGPFA